MAPGGREQVRIQCPLETWRRSPTFDFGKSAVWCVLLLLLLFKLSEFLFICCMCIILLITGSIKLNVVWLQRLLQVMWVEREHWTVVSCDMYLYSTLILYILLSLYFLCIIYAIRLVQLWTTGYERRTPITTSDNTEGETTVVLGLQQLWSDAESDRMPY